MSSRSRTKTKKVTETSNYRMFGRDAENRALDLRKHGRLYDSIKEYGFLSCFPIACYRRNGKLIVKDGQHRLAIAEELGLSIWYIEEDFDFDIAVVNCTSRKWSLIDYAEKFADNGSPHYREGIDFAEMHQISIGWSFALLSGTASFGNVSKAFMRGDFVVKDRQWADKVAYIYSRLTSISKECKNSRLLGACMAVCRVEEFSAKRLLSSAARCRDRLLSYSTRDAYLEMLEEIYNYGKKQLVPLRINALQAMKGRIAATTKKETEQ